jgi:hypothetical protein
MSADLRVAPTTHDAAAFAVQRWHYSRTLPPGRLIKLGVWENERFIGAVVYGRGASPKLGKSMGVELTEVCELVRVALDKHETPVSQIVALSLRELQKASPGTRLVVSFADTTQGHHGGIYQAGNWIYAGTSSPNKFFRDRSGKLWHPRLVSRTGGQVRQFGRLTDTIPIAECVAVTMPGKHRYLYPLDRATRRRVQKLAQPYPIRGSAVKVVTP